MLVGTLLVSVGAELSEAMRRPGIDLNFVKDPGALQFPCKRRDIVHAHGGVGPAMGNQDRRGIRRKGLTLGRVKAAMEEA